MLRAGEDTQLVPESQFYEISRGKLPLTLLFDHKEAYGHVKTGFTDEELDT